MKIRNCFVSNSSSSSFIIYGEEGKQNFLNSFPNTEFYKTDELIKNLKELKDSVKQAVMKFRNIYGFTEDSVYVSSSHIDAQCSGNILSCLEEIDEQVKNLEALGDNTMITEPIDRDEAYERNICNGCWETDL